MPHWNMRLTMQFNMAKWNKKQRYNVFSHHIHRVRETVLQLEYFSARNPVLPFHFWFRMKNGKSANNTKFRQWEKKRQKKRKLHILCGGAFITIPIAAFIILFWLFFSPFTFFPPFYLVFISFQVHYFRIINVCRGSQWAQKSSINANDSCNNSSCHCSHDFQLNWFYFMFTNKFGKMQFTMTQIRIFIAIYALFYNFFLSSSLMQLWIC